MKKQLIITIFCSVILLSSVYALDWKIVSTKGTGAKCPSNLRDMSFGNKGYFVKDYATFTLGDDSLAQVSLCSYGGTGEAVIETEPFTYDSDNPIQFKAHIPVVSGFQVFAGVDGKFYKQLNSPTWWQNSYKECFKDMKVKGSKYNLQSSDPIYSDYSYPSSQWGDGEEHKLTIRVVKADDTDCFNVMHIKDIDVKGNNILTSILPDTEDDGDEDGPLDWLKDFFLEDEKTAIPNEQKLEEELLKLGKVLDKRYYVANPFVDDDPLVIYGAFFAGFQKYLNDYTFNALITGKQGITCGEYVDKTKKEVKNIVKDIYGDRARLDIVYMSELSSKTEDPDLIDRWDKTFDVNHVCFRITYPDGKQEYIDFWSYQSGDPLLGPWKEKENYWKGVTESWDNDALHIEEKKLI